MIFHDLSDILNDENIIQKMEMIIGGEKEMVNYDLQWVL
jgi:hypothetical protein